LCLIGFYKGPFTLSTGDGHDMIHRALKDLQAQGLIENVLAVAEMQNGTKHGIGQ